MRRLFIIGMGLILLGAGCSATTNTNTSTSTDQKGADNSVGQTQGGGATQTSAGTYTMAEVATHNTATSCWTVVNGKVYDVTKEENKHPGGKQAILVMCGVDASSAFNNQHGSQRKPEQDLAGLQIGTLK